MNSTTANLFDRLQRLNAIGVALSAEKNTDRLLERILESAKELTNADGGTLYLRTEDDTLRFAIMLTDSLGLRLGGTSGEGIDLAPLPLYDADGQPNHHMVAAHAAVEGKTVNVPDAYEAEDFDFSGPRAFDEQTGYHSKSFLTVPMVNHEGTVIGVLQVINARDAAGEVVAFSLEDQRLVESLASQAAVSLTNKRLIDDQKQLFESFIELIAGAIDDKSPYTGGHCRRVPVLTMMLANAAAKVKEGPLRDFQMDADDRYELRIAGWLHDCGKITTPEYVVDKSTKLETIYDRIAELETRLAVLKRDAELFNLKRQIAVTGRGGSTEPAELDYQEHLRQLKADRDFLRACNVGGESMSEADIRRVKKIARRRWVDLDGRERPLLSDNEVYNLTVTKGTLTPEERQIINYHIVATIRMLEALPYPQHLKRVPEFAGGHHEHMDGSGYPRGLTREQMSVQARVMGIADIFEALTAQDRPYKNGMKLSEALRILGQMKLEQHIDSDLFDVFVREKVYLQYAEKFLKPEQIDRVDESQIPGYGVDV